MKIKWLGHASFLITSDTGVKIIVDPYTTTSSLTYRQIVESADIVTVSHEHGDHNNVAAVRGNPEVVKGTVSKEIKGIRLSGIAAFHDGAGGSQRGGNTIFLFEVDGVRVCHLGDLGHPLDAREVAVIGKVDVLLVPVGGFYTIDAKIATDVCEQLAPRVILPMHYKNDRCGLPISGVDEFLQGKAGVDRRDASELELNQGKLPAIAQIVVLKPVS